MTHATDVGVIGLGKFGSCLAQTLMDLNQNVIGIDRGESKVKQARSVLAHVYQADATDKTALQQLGFAELDRVIVSIGHSMEASILILLTLKEMGVEQVWVKAISEDHEKILYKLGADFVAFPERFVARQLARRIAMPGLISDFSLGSGVAIQELTVDKWDGQTLMDLDLPNKYDTQVVAVKRHGDQESTYIPKAGSELKRGDIIVTIGTGDSIADLV